MLFGRRGIFLLYTACHLIIGTANGVCIERPQSWVDSSGKDCQRYQKAGLCTSTGGYGSGWKASWGTFQNYAVAGVDATIACCGCGGGYDSSLCTDVPLGWTDKSGKTCTVYQQKNWCNNVGGYGPNWLPAWGTFSNSTRKILGAVAVNKACCACGGGSSAFPVQPTVAPTPAPTRQPTLRPSLKPTTKPTPTPTLSPTPHPTPRPTPKPTPNPTPRPTPKPTPNPTPRPTTHTTIIEGNPTPSPTPKPTPRPTPPPSPYPTRSPTPQPTPIPTRSPTPEPTPIPTPIPTVKPTTKPTPTPTANPTATPTPTPTPTTKPTLAPTPGIQKFVYLQPPEPLPPGEKTVATPLQVNGSPYTVQANVTASFSCAPYSVSASNNDDIQYSICHIYVCPGDRVTASGCNNQCNTTDQFLRLIDWDSNVPKEVAQNDDGCPVPGCSNLEYSVLSGTCRWLDLHQGCFLDTSCQGRIDVSTAVPAVYDFCADYSVTSVGLSVPCLQQMWSDAGCTAPLPSAYLEWWQTHSWGVSYANMQVFANSPTAYRAQVCYGSCSSYYWFSSGLSKDCLNQLWRNAGCLSDIPSTLLPVLQSINHREADAEILKWATTQQPSYASACYGSYGAPTIYAISTSLFAGANLTLSGPTSEVIVAPSLMRPISTMLTVAAYITTNSSGCYLMSLGRNATGSTGQFVFQLTTGGYLYFWDYNNGFGFNGADFSQRVNTNQRVHVAFVKNGLTGTFYINGIPTSTIYSFQPNTYTNNQFAVGKDLFNEALPFVGTIESVYISDYALTDEDVKSLLVAQSSDFVSLSARSFQKSTKRFVGFIVAGAVLFVFIVFIWWLRRGSSHDQKPLAEQENT